MANTYDIGDLVTMSAVFKVGATETDPTTITHKIKVPAGTITTTTWAASPLVLVRDSQGNYHLDFSVTAVTAAGTYHYSFIGTGTVQAAEEASFEVRKSAF